MSASDHSKEATKKVKVFVTGGAGYIGAHTCQQLHAQGYDIVVFDDLSTGSKENCKWGRLIQGDICDFDALQKAMFSEKPDAVLHFAAKTKVAESFDKPDYYKENNVKGTENVLKAMQYAGVSHIVFSGTAAVYGMPEGDCVSEDDTLAHQPVRRNKTGRRESA